jgi:hypothetical protein
MASTKVTLRAKRVRLEIELRLETKVAEPGHAGSIDTNLQPITEPYQTITLTMFAWENGREACFGQGIDYVESFAPEQGSPANRALLLELCTIWREWHLNDMQAGTELQRNALETMPAFEYPQTHYDTALAHLETLGLRIDRGYKYGSAWLTRRAPNEVVARLEAIFAALGGQS